MITLFWGAILFVPHAGLFAEPRDVLRVRERVVRFRRRFGIVSSAVWKQRGVEMRKDVAENINQLMIECGAKLDSSVRLVMDTSSVEEFEAYRTAIGQIMGTMLVDIMMPIYRQHPELKPAELDD